MRASEQNYVEIVEFLLRQEAKVDLTDEVCLYKRCNHMHKNTTIDSLWLEASHLLLDMYCVGCTLYVQVEMRL